MSMIVDKRTIFVGEIKDIVREFDIHRDRSRSVQAINAIFPRASANGLQDEWMSMLREANATVTLEIGMDG